MTPNKLQEMTRAAILGFAVGDALGVPAEFMTRAQLDKRPVTGMLAGGAHGQPAGTWSDDTSMTLCTLVSLTEKGVDYRDLMHRFALWLWEAKYTARDKVFDAGGTCRSAIFNFVHGAVPPDCGETAGYCCGNGSLMRLLPAALYFRGKGQGALTAETAAVIHDLSACTHGHPRCRLACGLYCAAAFALLDGTGKDALPEVLKSALDFYRTLPEFAGVLHEFEPLPEMADRSRDSIRSSGYVVDTLEAALWCLLATDSYRDCVLKAVNLGEDTDTVAAVAGGLAGILYGEAAIPADWLAALCRRSQIEALCTRFAESLPGGAV